MLNFIFNNLSLNIGRITILFGINFVLVLIVLSIKDKIKEIMNRRRKLEFPEEYRQIVQFGLVENKKPYCFVFIYDYSINDLKMIFSYLKHDYNIVGVINTSDSISCHDKLVDALTFFKHHEEINNISRLMYELPKGVNYHKKELRYANIHLSFVYYTLYKRW